MFLLYPNPNPLARSANRRWHQMPFFAKLAAVLKPGGTLTLATNIEAYAAEAEQFIQTIWGLRLIQRQAIRAGEIIPRTHFEKKYLARGETCWNLIFQKP
jgi:tRNA G46 methylase TrmB